MAAEFLMIPIHAPATVALVHVANELESVFVKAGIEELGSEVKLNAGPAGVGLVHPAVGGDVMEEGVAGPLAVAQALVGFVIHLQNRVQGGERLHGIDDGGQTELADDAVADDLIREATEVTGGVGWLRVGGEIEVTAVPGGLFEGGSAVFVERRVFRYKESIVEATGHNEREGDGGEPLGDDVRCHAEHGEVVVGAHDTLHVGQVVAVFVALAQDVGERCLGIRPDLGQPVAVTAPKRSA